MAEVEVRAAHNVLEACAQTDTIDKVVFTSSATAVIWRDDRKSLESDFDERHWSNVNLCRKYKVSLQNKLPFSLSTFLPRGERQKSFLFTVAKELYASHWLSPSGIFLCVTLLRWGLFCSDAMNAAVARAVEDTGGESGVGPGDGPWGEHGVRERRAADGA